MGDYPGRTLTLTLTLLENIGLLLNQSPTVLVPYENEAALVVLTPSGLAGIHGPLDHQGKQEGAWDKEWHGGGGHLGC